MNIDEEIGDYIWGIVWVSMENSLISSINDSLTKSARIFVWNLVPVSLGSSMRNSISEELKTKLQSDRGY